MSNNELIVRNGLIVTGATTTGGAGGISYVSFGHSTAAPNVLLQSNAVAPTGGSGTTAGAAGTVVATPSVFSSLGSFFSIAGQAGSAGGGANAAGTVVSAWTSIPLSGGGGGSANSNPGGKGGDGLVAIFSW